MSRFNLLKAPIALVRRFPLGRSALRIGGNLSEKNVSLVAGGVAFYAFLSIFPSILSLILLWEIFASETNAFVLLDFLSYIMPEQAFEIVADLLFQITEREKPASQLATVAALLVALWSSSRSIEALLMAVHMMYRTPYRPNMIKQRIIALGFTLLGSVFMVAAVLLIGAAPAVLEAMNLGAFTALTVLVLRWAFILIVFAVGTYALYFSCRRRPRKGEVAERSKLIPGAFCASILWLIVSFAFSYLLTTFTSYNEAFGSLGAIASLLVWLWLSAISLLIGAEINNDFDGKKSRARDRQLAMQSPIPPSE